jgi:hypothetical protein
MPSRIMVAGRRQARGTMEPMNEPPLTRGELRQLAADMTEALDAIEKIDGIDAALKQLRYVRDVLETKSELLDP